MDFMFAFLVAVADRIRGGLLSAHGINIPSKLETLLHGWTIALCFGHGFDLAGVWLMIALTFGEAVGWGHPLGWALSGVETGEPESYEVGRIADNPWVSLTVRGLLWALPAAPVAWIYDPHIWHLFWIMPLTMVAAPWIAVQTKRVSEQWFGELWGAQEIYRGLMTGLFVVLVA